MDARQKRRALYKTWKRGYYHLCTDGWKGGRICHDEREYVFVVNSISLLNLLFSVTVHAYEVMRNHLHLLLSGSGADCVAAFDYLRKRIDKMLREDGHPPLPEDYDFRLIPVEDEEQMRKNFIYIARNASMVQNIRPGGYLFGSSMVFYTDVPTLFGTVRAGDLSVRELIRMFRSNLPIPPERPIHPALGMALPQGFVDPAVLYKVFPSAREYETRLVKDYEAFVEIAEQAGEDILFSIEEARDIVNLELMKTGRRLSDLSSDDRCFLAVQLNKQFKLDAATLSRSLFVPAHVVSQVLRSKQYNK